MENKADGDDLFDRLEMLTLNEHLILLTDGLIAKVFGAFHVSFTLQNQLDQLTNESDNVKAKMVAYNRAKRAVAVLCNHQRAIPKNYTSMMNLEGKRQSRQQKNI